MIVENGGVGAAGEESGHSDDGVHFGTGDPALGGTSRRTTARPRPPMQPPMTMDGPKTPPDPPELIVSEVVTIFAKATIINTVGNTLAGRRQRRLKRSVPG